MTDSSFWRGKRVFITGHTGFKGAWLSQLLAYLGADVTGYALDPELKPNLFEICKPETRSIIGDVRCLNALSDAFKSARPEIVIHMAAQPLVLRSYSEPGHTYEVNVMGTVNLFECIKQCGCVKSVLNVTTDKVYLNNGRIEGYREDAYLCGADPYANSKSCSELVTFSYKNAFFNESGIAVSTARSGNVVGGGDFSANRLLPDCAIAASKGEAVKIRNPDALRPYQHVLDTLFAYLTIAEAQYENLSCADVYNIGPSESGCTTNSKIASLFCETWGAEVKWEEAHVENPHESAVLKLDCSKIKRELGWVPLWNIERAIYETVLWYRAYFSGDDANALMARQIKEFSEAKLNG